MCFTVQSSIPGYTEEWPAFPDIISVPLRLSRGADEVPCSCTYHTSEEEYKVALGERFIDPSPEWRDVLASRRFMDQKDGTPVSV
jgi:hypothetical protein